MESYAFNEGIVKVGVNPLLFGYSSNIVGKIKADYLPDAVPEGKGPNPFWDIYNEYRN